MYHQIKYFYINLATLDGKGTFHGMRIISIASFRKNIIEKSVCITRKSRIQASGLCHEKGIPLYTYDQPDVNSLLKLQFKPLTHLKYPYVLPKHTETNFLWDIS